jgi:hypothetical protein
LPEETSEQDKTIVGTVYLDFEQYL